jgi:hypothetical protein
LPPPKVVIMLVGSGPSNAQFHRVYLPDPEKGGALFIEKTHDVIVQAPLEHNPYMIHVIVRFRIFVLFTKTHSFRFITVVM